MLQLFRFPLTSFWLCLCISQVFTYVKSDLAVDPNVAAAVAGNPQCPDDLLDGCSLRCPDDNYVLDYAGCPMCACPQQNPPVVPVECPMMKCRANCGDGGYKIDKNGCQTCQCNKEVAVEPRVECSRVMCRMFCVHGFRRDQNGCEVCQCNDTPQPCPSINCQNNCPNGYRKDYSGCQTCSCEEGKGSKDISEDGCPAQMCRMFCMYGFKKNSKGCDVCECNWSPVAEQIACSERIPCTNNRVCNLNLQLCETVSADKVNWFVYKFNVKTDLFRDHDFVETFKKGLINNIATKYDLEVGQITVSSVENDGTTSFQIMPYYTENLDDFQRKIDQIDLHLNSNEFNTVLPMVASAAHKKHGGSKWNHYLQKHPRFAFYLTAVSFGLVALVLAGILAVICRQNRRFPQRSDSKLPIYETSYHQAPTEDDHYHAVHAPDGTAYVVVESDEMSPSNEKRTVV